MLSSQDGVLVSLLTSRPELWKNNISVSDINGKRYEGSISKISDNPADVIPGSDIVFFCMPGFLIKDTLLRVKPYISESTVLGSIVSSTGFFFFAHDVLGKDARLFGFQRVPFIARLVEYGQSATLLGYKQSLAVAVENVPVADSFRLTIEHLFHTQTSLLGSYLEASLTNSNPILHTGRLFSMWRDWSGQKYDDCILFYKEWDEESAQLLIDMDDEFMSLLDKLPMNKSVIPTLLDYYESTDAKCLSNKLRSIKAFQTIQAPMKRVEGGWIPDFSSRYFTEDFPFGLYFLVNLAKKYNVDTPKLNMVYEWGMSKLNEI
ncbi:MAG: NAD/NADP octopine/nopaline dehydrogenase family protein [Paludibacteraceae bacterium]|nr:NAD/NADP octopine/nopaline dehydrogenase family protein [Paludibacteraceae bacterium]